MNPSLLLWRGTLRRAHTVPRWFSLAAAGALLISGCGPATQRADLVVLNGAEPESLDPAIITGQPEGRIVLSLFEGDRKSTRLNSSH